MHKVTFLIVAFFAAFQTFSLHAAETSPTWSSVDPVEVELSEEVNVPTDRWFFCSGEFDQPDECGEPGFPHIAVYNEDYEGLGLSCGIGEQLSFFALTADIAYRDSPANFAMDVQVEGFDANSFSDVSYLAPPADGDAAWFMQMEVPDSLVTELARGNIVNITIYQDELGSIYVNSFRLRDSARSIRELRNVCSNR